MTNMLKIIFAGTPEFAATHLKTMLAANTNFQIVGVYTQPDRPAGRGKKLMASPVKILAEQHNIPIFQPTSLKNIEAQQQIASLQADLMVVVAYGLILPQAVLDMPRLGCINSHASILPRWRGAAPIQRAIQAGDTETGITVMQMEAGLDTGPMLLTLTTPITQQDTSSTLHDRLADLGAKAILEVINGLIHHQLTAKQQNDSLATYAHKLSKEEALIDWNKPATEIAATIRAFNPWPICHTLIQGQTLKILAAHVVDQHGPVAKILAINKEGLIVACGQQALCLTQIQLSNSKAMPFVNVYNGHQTLFENAQELG